LSSIDNSVFQTRRVETVRVSVVRKAVHIQLIGIGLNVYIQSIPFVDNFVCGKGDTGIQTRENHRHLRGYTVTNLESGKFPGD
jgi:hypothetical protein